MFSEKIDVSKLEKIDISPAHYNVYYHKELDITILDNGKHQRIYFERIKDIDNNPHNYSKCQHFGAERYNDGYVENLI
jgi:hypothetical protein